MPTQGSKRDIRLDAALAFDGSVTAVRAVAKGRAAALSKMGIHTVRDLLTHFPRRYIDMSTLASIAESPIGKGCTIVGTVHKVELKRPASKPYLNMTEITLVDNTGTLMITCFRQPWLVDRLSPEQRVAVSGMVEFKYGFKRMTNPFIEVLEDAHVVSGTIIPVHPASASVQTGMMRTLISNAFELVGGLEDPLPVSLRSKYRLMSRANALRSIHFPESLEQAAQARRRLAYEEVLLLQLYLMRGTGGQKNDGVAHVIDGQAITQLGRALPFNLTDEQAQAVAEILERMSYSSAANHMLLGDVGTGKTIVAAFALAAAADTGGQALMMAPTEVLVNQYANALGPLLDTAKVSWGLLTGSTDADERARISEGLSQGSLSVVFGTHALLEDAVAPKNCTLVVIDEQQRFGVDQRKTLIAKGPNPDVLSLTATPIPRTLALALYGNMSLSYLRTRPCMKVPTKTQVFTRGVRGEAYEIAREALESGQQVYVVCPLVGSAQADDDKDSARKTGKNAKAGQGEGAASDEEDDYLFARIAIEDESDLSSDNTRAAIQEAEYLQAKIFPGFTVGVLHGRMASEEKARTMQDFRDNRIQVLVATTVIEVGVDVPNATVMIIEDADRFGLAQLHQLRGRVGRGDIPGTVCLISNTKAPVALERLSAMERTTDGFELAEYDLSLRREGDILGNRQHGASVLKLVNVVKDAAIIETAHGDAQALLEADADLSLPEHAALKVEIARTFETLERAARKGE